MTLIGEIYRDGAAVAARSRGFPLVPPRQQSWRSSSRIRTRSAVDSGCGWRSERSVAAKAQFERAAAKNHSGALYNLGIMELGGANGKTPALPP